MLEGCVSIIVPVHNSAQVLEKCITSIIGQTYRNLQIILVDDGSEDKSGELCDYFAQRDSRIEVYHLCNQGVSATRNYALSKVKGAYIQFVDSDDYLKKNMTEYMVSKMEAMQADMVVCNYLKAFARVCIPNKKMEKTKNYTSKEYLCNTLKDPGHHYFGVVWNKLYKAQIILREQMMFDNRVTLGEDFIFNLQYLSKCEKVSAVGRYLYYYNKQRDASLSQVRRKTIADCQKELTNRHFIYAAYVKTFRNTDKYEKYKEEIYFYWIVFYIRQVAGLTKEYKNWQPEEKQCWWDILQKDANIQESLKNVPKAKVQAYDRKYRFESEMKRILKKIGGIV